MARYSNRSVTVPASLLLRLARARTEGLTQGRLAEAVGISPAAMNRYEKGLREPSLAEVQRIVGHTDVRLVPTLRREPRSRGVADYELPDPFPYAPDESRLAARLPAELLSRTSSLPGDDGNGPQLPEALLHLYEIEDLARDARQVAERLQRAWAEEHETRAGTQERYRDLTHQLEVVGHGACQAVTVLARVIDDQHIEERPGRVRARSAPEPPRIGTLAWAHVVCCLRAEAALCAERAALLRAALEAAGRQSAAQARLEEAEERARTAPGGAGEGLEAAREDLKEAHRKCKDLCWGGVGGVRRIGQAGERYLAIELDQLAQRARALYDELSGTPAFTAWRTRHAAVDPLYDLWLDGPLSLWPAPPAFYRDQEAFYAAWEHRDLAAAREKLLQAIPDGSLASMEGTFPDQSGGQWTVSIQVPSATVRNDDWTESTAVVTAAQRAAGHEGKTGAMYVLARGVNARQAGALMDQTRGAASLKEIGEVAARLYTLPAHP